MARMRIDGMDEVTSRLMKMENGGTRDMIRRIVNAGAEAAAEEMRGNIQDAEHIRTGSMMENVRSAGYKETYGGGSADVYPQETDNRGIRNAMKAFVINYGYGGRKTARTGDKFITGKFRQTEKKARAAMEAESRKILQEMGLTE